MNRWVKCKVNFERTLMLEVSDIVQIITIINLPIHEVSTYTSLIKAINIIATYVLYFPYTCNLVGPTIYN